MNQLLNSYLAPTPNKWRKVGDTLMGISTTITGYGIANDNHAIAYTALICGVLGKILTDLFTTKPEDTHE